METSKCCKSGAAKKTKLYTGTIKPLNPLITSMFRLLPRNSEQVMLRWTRSRLAVGL